MPGPSSGSYAYQTNGTFCDMWPNQMHWNLECETKNWMYSCKFLHLFPDRTSMLYNLYRFHLFFYSFFCFIRSAIYFRNTSGIQFILWLFMWPKNKRTSEQTKEIEEKKRQMKLRYLGHLLLCFIQRCFWLALCLNIFTIVSNF